MDSKIVFGINMSHDMACAAVIDGEVKVAIEEERLNGIKHSSGSSPYDQAYGRIIPFLSIRYCCDYLGIEPSDVDLWVVNSIFASEIEPLRIQLLGVPWDRIIDVETPGHHLCHAYSAFFTSLFEEAAVLSLDVNGGLSADGSQKENYSLYYGQGSELNLVFKDMLNRGELSVPELYIIYSTILHLTPWHGGDYGDDEAQRSGGKLMGYAAHYFNEELRNQAGKGLSKPFAKSSNSEVKVPSHIVMEEGHRYAIKMKDFLKYMRERGKVLDTSDHIPFDSLVGWEMRDHIFWKYRKTPLQDFNNVMFAYEAQLTLEEYILKMANYAHELTGSKNLCVSGGPMLNVTAANRILKETPFEKLFVQPSANDAGNAIGAALWGYYKQLGGKNRVYTKKTFNTCLGKRYGNASVEEAIHEKTWSPAFTSEKIDDEDQQADRFAKLLADQHIVCLFKGRSEFGPRALGSRSFLASPRDEDMLKKMNAIKGREWYRPVAPLVLKEVLHEYFDAPFDEAPFMTINAHCKENTKKLVPGIVHVDGSARVQTVSEEYYPFLTKLLRRFAQISGQPPILINTSFNINGPIVETPEQAIETFLKANCQVKALLLEDFLLELPCTTTPEIAKGGARNLTSVIKLWEKAPAGWSWQRISGMGAKKVIREIRRATRRRFTEEEKIRVVLEGLRGDISVTDLCRRERITPPVYHRWSKSLLEASKNDLNQGTVCDASSEEVHKLKAENEALKKALAELTGRTEA